MLKKILLGVLIIGICNIGNTVNASKYKKYNDNMYENLNTSINFLNNILEFYDSTGTIFNITPLNDLIYNIRKVIEESRKVIEKSKVQYKYVINIITLYHSLNDCVASLKQTDYINERFINLAYKIINNMINIILYKLDENNFKKFVISLMDDLCNSDQNTHNRKRRLYKNIKINTIISCETLYDTIFTYGIFYKIEDVLSGNNQNSIRNKWICNIYDAQLTDNTKQILNRIIKQINNEYNKQYKLYTVPYAYDNKKQSLYFSTENNLINTIENLICDCTLPLTINQNKEFLKLYYNRNYYTSDHLPQYFKSCKSFYDLIMANLIKNRIMKILDSSNKHDIKNKYEQDYIVLNENGNKYFDFDDEQLDKNCNQCFSVSFGNGITVACIYDIQINDNMKKILDDVMLYIETIYQSKYELYTVPESDNVQYLKLAEGNNNFIRKIDDITSHYELPIDNSTRNIFNTILGIFSSQKQIITSNTKFLNRPYYSSEIKNSDKQIYDLVVERLVRQKIENILSKRQDLNEDSEKNNFKDEIIWCMEDEQLTNSTMKILDDIIRNINDKHYKQYKLYTVPVLDNNGKKLQNLYFSDGNNGLITHITSNYKLPLTVQTNEELIKLFAKRPYYSSNNLLLSCQYFYELIIACLIENEMERDYNFQDKMILCMKDNQLNDNTKKILNHIIQQINNKYNKRCELYTVPGTSANNKPIQRLHLSTKNNNLIGRINAMTPDCALPLTVKDNEMLLERYANQPYYSSDKLPFPNACKSDYDLIIANFIKRSIKKVINIGRQVTLIEFPNNQIIKHLQPIICDVFTSINIDNKYDWKIENNKLMIINNGNNTIKYFTKQTEEIEEEMNESGNMSSIETQYESSKF